MTAVFQLEIVLDGVCYWEISLCTESSLLFVTRFTFMGQQ